jgi:MoxR-like ATPase
VGNFNEWEANLASRGRLHRCGRVWSNGEVAGGAEERVARVQGSDAIYGAARQFVDRCLAADDSLFTPGRPIWTKANAEELQERVIERPEFGPGGFAEKMTRQLEGASAAVVQFAGELSYLHYLFIADVKGGTKRRHIERVLSADESSVPLPAELADTLDAGLASWGAGHAKRQDQVRFLIKMIVAWKSAPDEDRGSALRDPWEFKRFLQSLDARGAQAQREALLHLVHPDTFEPIVALAHKNKLLKAFEGRVTPGTDDIDRAISQVRASLESELGGPFHFYQQEVRSMWLEPPEPDGGGTRRGPRTERVGEVRDLLSVEAVRDAADARGLRIDDSVYLSVVGAIRSGKHIVLTGPPGTAKTTLALAIAEAAQSLGLCEDYVLTTATADWTTYETIGGLRPTGDGTLEFRDGHLLDAIRKQHWLIIDELNRSNFDRAFGQLFTVLSGQPVVLPYEDPAEGRPIALVPEGEATLEKYANIEVPASWQLIATMNVFDKSLLFEMSYALMRRFAFIEVRAPDEDVYRDLISEAASGHEAAREATELLLPLRRIKELGPAMFMDIARFARERLEIGPMAREDLAFQAFYSYLLPQFEGISDREGSDLFRAVAGLVGAANRERLFRTLESVLGLELGDGRRLEESAEPLEDDSQ